MSKTMNNGPDGPHPPYGVAIRDAVARGDSEQLGKLVRLVRESLAELAVLDAGAFRADRVELPNTKKVRAVEAALQRLEAAIRELEGSPSKE